ncbi:MAG: serine/threonine-protein kinase [Acidobacteriota bacterium]
MAQQRLGQYELLDRIGKGGMGVVYRARDTQLGRLVAIKLLPPEVSSEPERRSRFLREAQAAANLNHPHIATVYQFGTATIDHPELATPLQHGEATEVPFLVMELVEGQDLQSLIHQQQERSPMAVGRALKIAGEILQGLEAAHRAGIVHRDLKPNNVRITPRGEVKILDFGLAKFRQRRARRAHGENEEGHGTEERSEERHSGGQHSGGQHSGEGHGRERHSGEKGNAGSSFDPREESSEIPTALLASIQTTQSMLLGTPPYMAPEQLRTPDVDGRCDLFALGVVLYQMLAGRPPYSGRHLLEYVKSLAKDDPQPLNEVREDVSPQLWRAIARLLEHDPEDRFSTAQEAAQALKEAGGGGPETAPTQIRPALLPSKAGGPWWRRGPLFSAAFGKGRRRVLMGGLALAGIALLLLLRSSFTTAPNGPLTVEVQGFENRTDIPELTRCLQSLEVYLASELPGLSGVRVVDPRAARGPAERASVLLRGTLIQVGGTPRTNLQFLASDTGAQIVSLAYDGDCRQLQGQLPDIALTSSLLLQVCAESGAGACTEPESMLSAGMRRVGMLFSPQDPEGAERLFHLALRMDPDHALAYAARSIVRQNRYEMSPSEELLEAAQLDASTAVELQPEAPMAHYALGRLYRLRGNTERALEHLQLGVGYLEPSETEGQFLLEISAAQGQQGDWAGARETLLQITERWPLNWWYRNQLGGVEYRLGSYEDARQHWRQAADLAGPRESAWPLGNLALLALQVDGDIERALSIYRQIPETAMDGDTAAAQAFLLYSVGRFEDAAGSYQRAIQLQPNDPSLYADLGDTYERLERPEAAEGAYQEALRLVQEQLRLTPGKADLQARQPLYLAKLGRCPEALREADRLALTAAPPDGWLRIAQSRALCEQPEAAIDALLNLVDQGDDPCRLLQLDELAPLQQQPRLAAALAERGRPLEACQQR